MSDHSRDTLNRSTDRIERPVVTIEGVSYVHIDNFKVAPGDQSKRPNQHARHLNTWTAYGLIASTGAGVVDPGDTPEPVDNYGGKTHDMHAFYRRASVPAPLIHNTMRDLAYGHPEAYGAMPFEEPLSIVLPFDEIVRDVSVAMDASGLAAHLAVVGWLAA